MPSALCAIAANPSYQICGAFVIVGGITVRCWPIVLALSGRRHFLELIESKRDKACKRQCKDPASYTTRSLQLILSFHYNSAEA